MSSLSASRPKVYPAVHGSCSWRGGISRDALERGFALLRIATTNASNGAVVSQTYWVKSIRGDNGALLGFRLTRHNEDSTEGPVYDVDLCHDADPKWWVCDCPDATSRQREDGLCKHRKALAALLPLVPQEEGEVRWAS